MKKQKTPLCLAIEQFELLKQKSTKLTDVIYLDGVISVLESLKPTEREMFEEAYQNGVEDNKIYFDNLTQE